MNVSQKQRWAQENLLLKQGNLLLKDEVDKLKAENERLKNALEFYARRIIDDHVLIKEIINENGKNGI